MIKNLFSKYFILSLIISFFPMFTGYCMETNEDDAIPEQNQSQIIHNQVDFDFNLLALLPREILHDIMMLLLDDSSFEGLRSCYKSLHKVSTKELSELTMKRLYKTFLMQAENLPELKKIICKKYKALDQHFPNYDLLNQAYCDYFMEKQNNLDENHNTLLRDFKANSSSKWYFWYWEFKTIINKKLSKIRSLTQNLDNEENISELKSMTLVLKSIKNKLIPKIILKVMTDNWSFAVISSLCFSCLIPTLMILLNNEHNFIIKAGAISIETIYCFMSSIIIKNEFIKPITGFINQLNALLDVIEGALDNIQDTKLQLAKN